MSVERELITEVNVRKDTETDSIIVDKRASIFDFRNFIGPLVPIIEEASRSATAILRSDRFAQELLVALDKRVVDHAASLSNRIRGLRVFLAGAYPQIEMCDKNQYTCITARSIFWEDKEVGVGISTKLLRNMSNVLFDTKPPRSAAQLAVARRNFRALLAAKLVNQVSHLLVSLEFPDEPHLLIEKKKKGRVRFAIFGNYMEVLLFGGILQLTSWLGYQLAHTHYYYSWSLSLQASESATSLAREVTNVDTLVDSPGAISDLSAPLVGVGDVHAANSDRPRPVKKRKGWRISKSSVCGPKRLSIRDEDGRKCTIIF